MSRVIDGRRVERAVRQACRSGRPEDADTIAEQDQAIRAAELAELDQLIVQLDSFDSSDKDYGPPPQMPT